MDEIDPIAIENLYGAGTYQRYPIIVTRGRGATLYDADGKEYIDLMGGYGVGVVGHCHPHVVEAIKKQSEKLITCHGSLYNDKRVELLERLIKIAPRTIGKAFLCNSGSEAIECALKLALKFTGRVEVIAMKRGYHGKTFGALSTTWNPKYRRSFQSLLPKNVNFVPFGDPESLRSKVTDKTAAVLLEPIQGESGIHLPPEDYLRQVSEICEEKGSLLILDEIQSGLGRTGKMWASQHWRVDPDVMCIAKGLAGGVPMGVTLARAEIMDSLSVGEHTTTFGGNPLACAAAIAAIEVLTSERLPERATVLGKYFIDQLKEIRDELRIVRDVRGLGLMVGLESRFDIYNVLMKAINRGAILLYSGKNVLRFLPPLVISKEQLEKAAGIVRRLMLEEELERLK